MSLPRLRLAAIGFACTVSLAASALPPARSGPTRPVNIDKSGPPIPTAPATESAHPAAIPLWADGAPGSEARKNEPEEISWRQEPDIVFPVLSNVHNPNLTPFLPAKDQATGCAVIIAPGGGHMQHTIDREGYDLARWFAERGIATLAAYVIGIDVGGTFTDVVCSDGVSTWRAPSAGGATCSAFTAAPTCRC